MIALLIAMAVVFMCLISNAPPYSVWTLKYQLRRYKQ